MSGIGEPDGALVDFMMDGRNYPERPASVECHETHISLVFVGDQFVYKIKKSVDFGFLDFTTLERRRYFCTQEVVLNSRLAPGIYLGVVPVYEKDGDYTFRKKKGARVSEYAVKMRRLDEGKLLYQRIAEGDLLYGRLGETGDILGRFHRGAPVHITDSCGDIDIVRMDTEENFEQTRACIGITVQEAIYSALVSYTRGFLEGNRELFRERKAGGWIREGHGDLHSRHVCLTTPQVIFDCIEFNKRFRIADVLADIAFLLMDLEFQGRFDLSAALDNAYFSTLPEACSPDLLRFYKVYRAVVRGKIEGFTADSMDDEASIVAANLKATNYYALARYYAEERTGSFNPVVLMGVSGVGKSAIARGLLPGAVVLRSDEIRKDMAGLPRDVHLYTAYGKDVYGAEVTARVYDVLREETLAAARNGMRIVVDATFLKADQRLAFHDACLNAGLNPFFVHCSGDPAILKERVMARQAAGTDISDAGVAVLERQLEAAEDPAELPFFRVMRLNAAKEPVDAIRQSLRQFL